jgi:hypothetical protein
MATRIPIFSRTLYKIMVLPIMLLDASILYTPRETDE